MISFMIGLREDDDGEMITKAHINDSNTSKPL